MRDQVEVWTRIYRGGRRPATMSGQFRLTLGVKAVCGYNGGKRNLLNRNFDEPRASTMSWITMLGTPRASCDGITRRETLAAGALTLLGGLLNTRSLLAVEQSADAWLRPAKAKSVVLLYLQGGPPTQDMFDLKPDAPSDVAGEFKPIATSAPGVEIGELLPLTARWMHKAAIVRSVYHQAACHLNVPMYTGFDINLPDEEFRDSDPPSMGSVCAYLSGQPGRLGHARTQFSDDEGDVARLRSDVFRLS